MTLKNFLTLLTSNDESTKNRIQNKFIFSTVFHSSFRTLLGTSILLENIVYLLEVGAPVANLTKPQW